MNFNPVQSGNPIAQNAQGLASLGRNQDSMLMHVTPNEVAGLQTLAQQLGGSLTVNPQTGLPEAGFLDGVGDFIGNLLPTAIGAGIGYGTGNPLLGATIAGGIKTAETGDLGAGILAGIGAYTGAGTMGDIAKMGAQSTALPAATTSGEVAGIAGEGASTAMLGGADAVTPAIASTPISQGGLSLGGAGVDLTSPVAAAAPVGGDFGQLGQGLSALTKPGGFSQFAQQTGSTPLGAGFKLASPFLGAGLETLAEQNALAPIAPEGMGGFGKFTPLEQLRKRYSQTTNMAQGGQVPTSYGITGQDRLSALPIGQQDNPFSTFTGYNVPRNEPYGIAPEYNSAAAGLNAQYRSNGGNVQQFAAGGPTNIDEWREYYQDPMAFEQRMAEAAAAEEAAAAAKALQASQTNPFGYPSNIMSQNAVQPSMAAMASMGVIPQAAPVDTSPAASSTIDQLRGQYAGMAKGGYLDGPGDGMSDDIHATIEGKQPARLADGEFVVPADVVSHLGNGSTKAGAKKLYAMMDKVRVARTGTKKQGKQIKADKYLPS